MVDEAAALLDDLGALRRKARRDGRGEWLPLLVFGGFVLAAPLAYLHPAPTAYTPVGPTLRVGVTEFTPLMLFQGFHVAPADDTVVGLYWLGVTIAGAVLTFLWYRRRAARIGVALPVRPFMWSVLGALALAVVIVPVVLHLLPGLLAPGPTALRVILLVAAGLALVVAWARPRRPNDVSWERNAIGVFGILLALICVRDITVVALLHGFAALYVIAAGLLGLAWTERNRLCGTVAVLFIGASLTANLYDMENVAERIGGPWSGAGAVAFDNLLLPGAVLVVGGLVALVSTWLANRRLRAEEPTR